MRISSLVPACLLLIIAALPGCVIAQEHRQSDLRQDIRKIVREEVKRAIAEVHRAQDERAARTKKARAKADMVRNHAARKKDLAKRRSDAKKAASKRKRAAEKKRAAAKKKAASKKKAAGKKKKKSGKKKPAKKKRKKKKPSKKQPTKKKPGKKQPVTKAEFYYAEKKAAEKKRASAKKRAAAKKKAAVKKKTTEQGYSVRILEPRSFPRRGADRVRDSQPRETQDAMANARRALSTARRAIRRARSLSSEQRRQALNALNEAQRALDRRRDDRRRSDRRRSDRRRTDRRRDVRRRRSDSRRIVEIEVGEDVDVSRRFDMPTVFDIKSNIRIPELSTPVRTIVTPEDVDVQVLKVKDLELPRVEVLTPRLHLDKTDVKVLPRKRPGKKQQPKKVRKKRRRIV